MLGANCSMLGTLFNNRMTSIPKTFRKMTDNAPQYHFFQTYVQKYDARRKLMIEAGNQSKYKKNALLRKAW